VEEENYFFRLSKYQDKLQQLIESDELRILPETKKNEILGFIKTGLEDFSISRSVERAKGWGVPVPDDKSQIIYVWIDALSCYTNGIGFGTDEQKFEKWWPANVHVIGKDIIRFHTVYWPAILLSAGLKLPKTVFVHGFLSIEGQKMSKSLGNVINPLTLLEKYSADELRYYLIRDIPTFGDGDFTEAALKNRTNKELLGDLGNLVNRVLTIVEKSDVKSFTGAKELESKINIEEIKDLFVGLELHEALEKIMEFVRYCNKYINEKEPWKLKDKELEVVLYNLLESIRIISVLLYPFIPKTSESIAKKLGTKIMDFDDLKFKNEFNGVTSKGEYLFKKIE
jgi:methionyl-tRNA synthetase